MNLNHALAVRSDFSIGESILQIDHIIEKAMEFGYETVALIDTMSLHGMVEFTNKAKKAGIQPIIGCRLRVYADPTYRKPPKASGIKEVPNQFYYLKVYITEEVGAKSLFKLLSKANSADYYYYHARCGLADVLALEGVAVSTGDMNSLFQVPSHPAILSQLQSRFGNDKVFVELVPIDTPLFDTLNAKAITAATNSEAPTLVTYPFLYREEGDAASLDVMGAIATNTQMGVTYRSRQFVKDFHFAEPKKVVSRVTEAAKRVTIWNGISNPGAWGAGVKNAEKLVAMCSYEFEKKPPCLPKMAENEFVSLGKKCIAGWSKRFTRPVLGYLPAPEQMDVYKKRLSYELSILKRMNFSGYFLLVEDLVTWSKSNGIIVGPGRGSAGGSLVSYLLGITDVDPIRFNLLFERFINPDRLDLPDVDLDFMSSKRHLTIEYLTKKYGQDHVAGISNYSTLASASALRDTGRIFGLSGFDLMATKLVPKEHGQSLSLTDAAVAVPELEKFRDNHAEVWRHAITLEGSMKSFGQHAAGIIVAGEPLIERAVVETRGESPVVNWDKRTVELHGLVKMDLLGLSTLDVLDIAKEYIKTRHGKNINYLDLPLDDPAVYSVLSRGETTGVFQLESSGMRKLLRDLSISGPINFDDIVAVVALYRPGPMDSGLMDQYIQIRQGKRSASYDHPSMISALESTLGVMIFQEQVMQVARDLAGFTLTEADHLRSAIGKKDKDKMASMKDKFVQGASAGFVEVELDDGMVGKVHASAKFKVLESSESWTIEQIADKGYTPINLQLIS